MMRALTVYSHYVRRVAFFCSVFFQAEDGIRDLVRSRGLGDVYKRQVPHVNARCAHQALAGVSRPGLEATDQQQIDEQVEVPPHGDTCLLYTSDAADERSSVDLGGRRIIKKKTNTTPPPPPHTHTNIKTWLYNIKY